MFNFHYLGIHIGRPFHHLLIDPETTYSKLIVAFKNLYNDLTTISASQLLTINKVVSFVSADIFKESLPEQCLLEVLKEVTEMYPAEIERFMVLSLKMFAEGFDYQKGAIFGFGPSANNETGSVLKIANVNEETLGKLDKFVAVHNLGEERNVGMVNYEIDIRGKRNLESASRKIVINR